MSVRRSSSDGPSGQHFLRSSRLAETLVREAAVRPGDLVVDLGAGRGALTTPLARAGARVIAVERDPRLVDELRSRFLRVSVIEADASRWSWPAEPFAVVANLPFAAASSILRSLLDDPCVSLRRADLIVQWEVAAKHTGVWPTTMRAALWGAWWELSITRRLAASAFAPPPSVSAAMLSIRRRREPLVDPVDSRAYAAFLRRAWRNGPVRRLMGGRAWKRLALEHGLDLNARPPDLDARQWAAVYRSTLPTWTRGRGRRSRGTG